MSLIDLGLGAYNLYQMDDAFDDARDDVKSGFNQATQVTKDYMDPYHQYGQWGMEGYKGLGEFDFDFNNYLGSDAYDWLIDEGLRGVQRSQAANKMLASKNTLDAMNEKNMMLAQNLYGQEHARQLAEHGANVNYYGGAVDTGAKATADMAQSLADLAVGRGGTMAGLTVGEAEAKAKALAALMSDRASGGGTVGGLQDLINMITGGSGGTGGTGGTGGGNPLWDGGGTDGQGDWGLIGDVGGLITGDYNLDMQLISALMGGELSDIDFGNISTDLFGDLDLGDIGNIDWNNILDLGDTVMGLFPVQGDDWDIPLLDDGSGLVDWDNILSFDDPNGMNALDLQFQDQDFWDSFTSGLGDMTESAWNSFVDWGKGFFS